MSLNSVLEIGKSGLGVYQAAIEVTGQNIANVNTPGYSRQKVVLESAPPVPSNGFPLGTGARIAAVQRIYDGLLQQQLVTAQSTEGNDTTRSNVLQQIEPTFNEVANDGLGAAISNFFGSWQDLTLNPAGSTERQTILARTQIMVDNFHAVSTTLNSTIAAQDNALVPLTADISDKLKSIAQLNGQISTAQFVSGNPNELMYKRDQLLRDLSAKIEISYTEQTDGTVDVKFADGVTELVTGEQYAAISSDKSVAGALSAPYRDIYLSAAGNPPPAASTLTGINITSLVTGTNGRLGELGATLALRDTVVPGYLAKIDELASQMVTHVNQLHKMGFDLNGAAGGDFFDVTTNPGNTAATISLNISDANTIAATTSATSPGDNRNALAIAQVQNTLINFTDGSATLNSYYDSFVSKIGLDVQSAKNTVAQDNAFTQQLSALREASSGVSLDEELTNLLKYQRSYQASAKLLTTASDMMDTVLGLIR